MSDDDIIFDDAALGELDELEAAYTNGTALPPRSIVNKPGLKQRDLFGAPIAEQPRPPPRPAPARGGTSGSGGAAGETQAKVRLTKTWDRASFAKHGWSKRGAAQAKAKAKGKSGKGKQRAYASDEEPWDEDEVLDDDEDDDEEFLIDTSYDPTAPILPIKWEPDPDAIQTFVYPVQRDKPLRTYQLNIVQRALYENTLVSLPTGLGKTFIAAVVMLNFYRWYPRGKVLFLAPTRPLVTQQIKACHYIAGIPQNDCIELTGGTLPKLRSIGWLTKRVIYSTPQTVERDLAKGRLDPRDVTCIVVDEAHRASGDYSYCGVVRYMMCRNPHFRVLALTATPGSKGEAVQEVIDNLHIGRIEVRADDSLDIRQYVHKKSFDLTVLPLGPHLSALRDKWANLMRPNLNQLAAARLVWSNDPVMLSPFAVQQAYSKIGSLPGGKSANGKYFPMIKLLASMARAMEYLVIQSVTQFESCLKDIQQSGNKNFVSSSGFRDVLRETNELRSRAGYVGHPKMEKLRSMCLEHFKNAQDERDEYTGEKRETRVMIFCNFRAVVEEIVACLNTQRPLIKATAFVGQASAKGVKGKSQKEQLETIKKFKRGDFNVLVATSIGEEGLDIGEIDLIICYEANKSPIRMLQRVGRTGRARDGHIIVLMAEGREERNWDRANEAYNEVQNALTSNKIFELYVDGERLLPADVKPRCEQVEIKALPLDIEKMTMNGQSRLERQALAEKKPKRKVDIHANAPDDAFLGFRTAGQVAAAKKEKALPPSQVLRKRKASALLTHEQESHLRSRWQQDALGRPVHPQHIDIEELPFERGMSGGAQRIPRHGERHLDLLAAMRTTDQLSDSRPQALDAWHDKLSKAFNPKLVEVFRAQDRQGPPLKHVRLRRPPPPSPDRFPVEFPLLTAMPRDTPEGAQNDGDHERPRGALFRTQSQLQDDPLARELFSSPVGASAADAPNKPPFRPPTSPLRPPSRPVSAASKAPTETLDLLDSDEENAQMHTLDVARPTAAPATSFSIELDDDDELVLSDSELLAGAVIRGHSGSPQKAAAPATKSKPIVLSDSDEAPAASPPPSVVRSKSPAVRAHTLDARSHSAGGTAFRPYVAPRPSASQPLAPARPLAKAAASRPPPAPSSFDDDDYSFFDFADDAELDAALNNIPEEAVRGRSMSRPAEVPPAPTAEQMPPPQSTKRHAAASLKRSIAVVPSSPAPAATRAAFRPAGSAAHASVLESSPAKAAKPMRRLAVPDSSEASSPVVGGHIQRYVETTDAAAAETTQAPRRLNRLRRGRQASDDENDGDDVVENAEESAGDRGKTRKKRRQSAGDAHDDKEREEEKKRKKKEILTHRAAGRIGIFDIEAVNPEASGSEASTEGYSSENSIDRDFVARSSASPERDDPDASVVSSGQQAQFYRDSLATQAPAGFGTPQFGRGGVARWQDRYAAGARRGIPITPASQDEGEEDDWSYGSFCVRSDEEIEYEESSPAHR
ncbi:uncharacterized protein JCM10292_005226 [Rhodotorula paludigena]|uniref:uncharacterized protein n=1 Tax=Rhodotorula paludigena TaxID=86838 RepID=UPI003180E376